jgi:hypothetical protein
LRFEAAGCARNVDCCRNRGQRIAQFVRKNGEKTIFLFVGLLQRVARAVALLCRLFNVSR